MKVAVTARGAGLGAWLDEDFAHCLQVVIVDDSDRFQAWDNPFREEPEDQAAEKLANRLIESNVNAIITRQIPASSEAILKKAGIDIHLAEQGAVLSLVEQARSRPNAT